MMISEILTPYYVVDKVALDGAVTELKNAILKHWPNSIIGYSYKTNSLPWLVRYMKEQGSYAEVVSDDEYSLAVYQGYEIHHIIYNGIAKSKETLLAVVEAGGYANIDSTAEVDWLHELPKNGRYKVGIRVNYDIEKECPGQTSFGEEGSRFGFCVENGDFSQVLTKILSLGNVEIVGLHMHTSTKSRSLNIYNSLTRKACELAKEFQLSLSYIDIGGGFFGGLSDKPNYDNYLETISSVLKDYYKKEELTLIVEPGVSIIGPYISYVTKVVDIKDTTKNRFVVTDGSRIHIDTRFVKKNYSKEFIYSTNDNRDNLSKQVVCGFTCMELDRIITLVDVKELKRGDLIEFHKVGAYTLSFAPLFIKYYPDVYVKENEKMSLIRKHWGAKEYSQNCF